LRLVWRDLHLEFAAERARRLVGRFRMRGLALHTLIGWLLACQPARADDGGIELARRRFANGQIRYQEGRYEEALVEFKAGKAHSPRPEFDYNIGQCLERLNRPLEAAEAFEEFVRRRPDDRDASRLRERIARLRPRPPVPTELPPRALSPPPQTEPPRGAPLVRQWWLWTTVAGVVAVGGMAIGLGIGLARTASYPATMPTDGSFRF
jgi:tetratricopeptide (TPR) repeat protein